MKGGAIEIIQINDKVKQFKDKERMNNCSDTQKYMVINRKCNNVGYTGEVVEINNIYRLKKSIDYISDYIYCIEYYRELDNTIDKRKKYQNIRAVSINTKNKRRRKMKTAKLMEILGEEFKSITLGNFKSKYGFEIETNRSEKIDAIQKWIEKFDKTPERRRKCDGMYNGIFVLNLDYNTFVMVHGKSIMDSDNKNDSLYIYIFGKKAKKYYEELTNYLKDKETNCLYDYVVSKWDEEYSNCVRKESVLRSFDSLFLDQHVKDKIIDHIDNFISNEKLYKDKNLLIKLVSCYMENREQVNLR